MTGQYAQYGQYMKAGARFAVGGINASGGVNGRKLKLIVEDDACDRTQAVEVAARLVKQQVALVIGHHCASASIAAAPIYAAAGIIMISPSTTDPQLTDKRAGPTIFRLAPRKDVEGSAIGSYIARTFTGKRVAILHDRTVVGIQLAADTKKAMAVGGLAETFYSGFIAGEPDYTKLVRDLRAQRIDAVFLGAFPTEAVLILRAMRREGITTVVVGSTLLATKDFYTSAKAHLNELVVYPGGFARDLIDPAATSEPPGPHEVLLGSPDVLSNAMSAVQVWAQAANAAKEAAPTGTIVSNAMQAGTFNFQPRWGQFGFTKKGDVTIDFYRMITWIDGDNMKPAR